MTRRWPIALLFFASGACALGYEVVWAKTLTLALGGTARAQAAVLASFLAGLAAGGAVLGDRADEAKRPLRFFALLEAAVALCGYLAPWLLSYKAGVSLVAGAAFLMGGTLPALTRLLAGNETLERTLARLYAVNNAGAAAGALLTGFVLIRYLGLTGASHALAGLGLVIAAAAWHLDQGDAAPAAPASVRTEPDAVPAGVILTAVAVSGVVSLALEAGWVRLLAVVLGASTYSFTVMLAGFVAGLGLGAFAVSAGLLPKKVPAARLYGLAQLGAGLAVLACWPLYERLPWLFWRMSAAIPKTEAAYPYFEAAKLGFCFLLTLIPTAFLGMAFPLAGRTAAARVGRVGFGVGAAAALAAVGNVVGALVSGLVLLPALGVQGLLTAAAGTSLLLGVAVLAADGGWPRAKRAAAAALAAAAFVVHLAWGGSWDRLLLAIGTQRYTGVPGLTFGDYLSALREKRAVVFQRDDAEASVSVIDMPEPRLRALMVNGKADASTGVDMATQLTLGELPFVLAPRTRSALLVGLGSGVTAGAALQWPLQRLDVAEISPAVAAADELFKDYNGSPLADPRLHLHVDDGRAFLRRSAGGYDALVSEPSNPWIAGVGNLYTQEYFRLARSRLSPGGVMVQWFHLYETDDEAVKSVLATFASVFEDVSVWRVNEGDGLLVGFNGAHAPDFAAMERALSGPPALVLARAGMPDLAGLFALENAGDASVRETAAGGTLNLDRRPYLEYAAPRGRFMRSFSHALARVEDDLGPRRDGLLLRRYLAWRKEGLSDEEYGAALRYDAGRRPAWTRALSREWRAERPRSEAARVWEARFALEDGKPAAALAALGPAFAGADAWEVAAQARYSTGDVHGARKAAVRAAGLCGAGKKAADLWLKASLWAMEDGKGGEAVDALSAALKADPEHEQARSLLDHLLKSYRKPPSS